MNRKHNLQGVLQEIEHYKSLRLSEHMFVDTGFDSDAAILVRDTEPYAVVKTTRQDVHFSYRHVYTESLVVAALEQAAKMAPPLFELPKVIESQVQKSPYYAVFSYVPGSMMSFEELSEIPPRNQVTIGRQLAEVVYWLEQHLTSEVVPELAERDYVPSYQMRLGLGGKYMHRYDDIANAGFESVAEAMVATTVRIDEQFTPDYLACPAYGHTDLWGMNMTFSQSPGGVSLRGIFDFGATNIRPTEYEFRFFNFISRYYTEGIVERYQELSGVELDMHKMDTWSSVQLLGPALYRICNDLPFEGGHEWRLHHYLRRPELYAT